MVKKKNVKKQILAKDFLQLLEDQECGRERPAFKPRKVAPPSGYLSPVQRELLELALIKTPRMVGKLATTLVNRLRKP